MKVLLKIAMITMLLASCSRSDTIHQNTAATDRPASELPSETGHQQSIHRFSNGMIIMPEGKPPYDTTRSERQ